MHAPMGFLPKEEALNGEMGKDRIPDVLSCYRSGSVTNARDTLFIEVSGQRQPPVVLLHARQPTNFGKCTK